MSHGEDVGMYYQGNGDLMGGWVEQRAIHRFFLIGSPATETEAGKWVRDTFHGTGNRRRTGGSS